MTSLRKNGRLGLNREIGKSWLASAKIARKAKQWQTAYSAMLQAEQKKVPYSFIDSAKLLKASGEPLRALTELENSIKLLGLFDNQVLDLTEDKDSERMKAKVSHLLFLYLSGPDIHGLQILLLKARWMNELDRYDVQDVYNIFKKACDMQNKYVLYNQRYHSCLIPRLAGKMPIIIRVIFTMKPSKRFLRQMFIGGRMYSPNFTNVPNASSSTEGSR